MNFLEMFLIQYTFLLVLVLIVQLLMELSIDFATSFFRAVIGFNRVQSLLRCDFGTFTFHLSYFTINMTWCTSNTK